MSDLVIITEFVTKTVSCQAYLQETKQWRTKFLIFNQLLLKFVSVPIGFNYSCTFIGVTQNGSHSLHYKTTFSGTNSDTHICTHILR